MQLESGPIPLSHQMEQHVLDRLRCGEFLPGAILPTEEHLCRGNGVSRITVRKALDSLMQKDAIIRRRGVGSFASERPGSVHSIRLTGSLEEFLQSAVQLRSRVVALGPAMADSEPATALGIAEGTTITHIELVSSSSDGPLGHLTIYFPEAIGKLLSVEDVSGDLPVVRMVERKLSMSAVRAQ
jgi:GntR family transcriptional regulator